MASRSLRIAPPGRRRRARARRSSDATPSWRCCAASSTRPVCAAARTSCSCRPTPASARAASPARSCAKPRTCRDACVAADAVRAVRRRRVVADRRGHPRRVRHRCPTTPRPSVREAHRRDRRRRPRCTTRPSSPAPPTDCSTCSVTSRHRRRRAARAREDDSALVAQPVPAHRPHAAARRRVRRAALGRRARAPHARASGRAAARACPSRASRRRAPSCSSAWSPSPGRHNFTVVERRPARREVGRRARRRAPRVTTSSRRLVALLHERTGGNPFFVEELAALLREGGPEAAQAHVPRRPASCRRRCRARRGPARRARRGERTRARGLRGRRLERQRRPRCDALVDGARRRDRRRGRARRGPRRARAHRLAEGDVEFTLHRPRSSATSRTAPSQGRAGTAARRRSPTGSPSRRRTPTTPTRSSAWRTTTPPSRELVARARAGHRHPRRLRDAGARRDRGAASRAGPPPRCGAARTASTTSAPAAAGPATRRARAGGSSSAARRRAAEQRDLAAAHRRRRRGAREAPPTSRAPRPAPDAPRRDPADGGRLPRRASTIDDAIELWRSIGDVHGEAEARAGPRPRVDVRRQHGPRRGRPAEALAVYRAARRPARRGVGAPEPRHDLVLPGRRREGRGAPPAAPRRRSASSATTAGSTGRFAVLAWVRFMQGRRDDAGAARARAAPESETRRQPLGHRAILEMLLGNIALWSGRAGDGGRARAARPSSRSASSATRGATAKQWRSGIRALAAAGRVGEAIEAAIDSRSPSATATATSSTPSRTRSTSRCSCASAIPTRCPCRPAPRRRRGHPRRLAVRLRTPRRVWDVRSSRRVARRSGGRARRRSTGMCRGPVPAPAPRSGLRLRWRVAAGDLDVPTPAIEAGVTTGRTSTSSNSARRRVRSRSRETPTTRPTGSTRWSRPGSTTARPCSSRRSSRSPGARHGARSGAPDLEDVDAGADRRLATDRRPLPGWSTVFALTMPGGRLSFGVAGGRRARRSPARTQGRRRTSAPRPVRARRRRRRGRPRPSAASARDADRRRWRRRRNTSSLLGRGGGDDAVVATQLEHAVGPDHVIRGGRFTGATNVVSMVTVTPRSVRSHALNASSAVHVVEDAVCVETLGTIDVGTQLRAAVDDLTERPPHVVDACEPHAPIHPPPLLRVEEPAVAAQRHAEPALNVRPRRRARRSPTAPRATSVRSARGRVVAELEVDEVQAPAASAASDAAARSSGELTPNGLSHSTA